MANSMISNPKLAALMERAAELLRTGEGLPESSREQVATVKPNASAESLSISDLGTLFPYHLNGALLKAADEFGVDLHLVEHVLDFNDEAPAVAEHDCDLQLLQYRGPSLRISQPLSLLTQERIARGLRRYSPISQALIAFAEAAAELNRVWDNQSENHPGDEGYPFGESFDEVTDSIARWRDAACGKS